MIIKPAIKIKITNITEDIKYHLNYIGSHLSKFLEATNTQYSRGHIWEPSHISSLPNAGKTHFQRTTKLHNNLANQIFHNGLLLTQGTPFHLLELYQPFRYQEIMLK